MTDNPYARTGSEEGASHHKGSGISRLVGWGIALIFIGLTVALLLPATRRGREPARRSQCKNNLKQIALALHNYADDWGGFPPAMTVDSDGKPLHSWRTLLLPYLDQKALYETIDLSKPWDDPANASARQTAVAVYNCPSDDGPEMQTSYLALVGDDLALHPTRVRPLNEFKDGLSNTVMVIEVPRQQTWEWMKPEDSDEATFLAFQPESKLPHQGGFHATLGDGSVRFLSASMPGEKRHALITISGGEQIGEF